MVSSGEDEEEGEEDYEEDMESSDVQSDDVQSEGREIDDKELKSYGGNLDYSRFEHICSVCKVK